MSQSHKLTDEEKQVLRNAFAAVPPSAVRDWLLNGLLNGETVTISPRDLPREQRTARRLEAT